VDFNIVRHGNAEFQRLATSMTQDEARENRRLLRQTVNLRQTVLNRARGRIRVRRETQRRP
jgi:hypothetical protein